MDRTLEQKVRRLKKMSCRYHKLVDNYEISISQGNRSFPFHIDCFLSSITDDILTYLTISVTQWTSYKNQEPFVHREHMHYPIPGFFGAVRIIYLCVFCLYVFILFPDVACVSGLFIFDCPFLSDVYLETYM